MPQRPLKRTLLVALGCELSLELGDGGLQFSIQELASVRELELAVIVLLWNNYGYSEIKSYMVANQIRPIGVDIYTPDFLTITRGFGCVAERARDLAHLKALLKDAPGDRPLIIEVREAPPFAP